MHPSLSFVLSGLALAAGLGAQSSFVPADTPGTGPANAFPFNTTNMRYQALVTAADLGSSPAVVTGFALSPGATATLAYGRVTMKMAHFAGAVLSTDFAANLAAGSVTTMDHPDWVWPVTANVWNQVDLQTPFFYNGVDHVVVEFTVLGRIAGVNMRRDATNQRVYLGSYTNQTHGTDGGLTAFKMRLLTGDAGLARFGRGCQGSNQQMPTLQLAGSSRLGQVFHHDLTNAVPGTPAVLAAAFDSRTVDLGPQGFPGCRLYLGTVAATLFTLTDGAGAATVPMGVPNDPSFVGLVLYSQWAALDALAPGGLVTSNYGRALLGN